MNGILQLFILLLLYSCVFTVPISIAAGRRKAKRPIYWWLFLLSLAIEITIIYIGTALNKSIHPAWLTLYLSPLVAALLAGLFYYYLSKKLDNHEQ